ncbi:MAG: hypothetical protein ACOC32_00320 [Nanoarchaeota archaeon]
MRVSTVLLFIMTFLVSSCAQILEVPEEERPQSQEEFDAEALLIATEERLPREDAKQSLAQYFPEFGPEEEEYFRPPPRRVKFINCTDTDGMGHRTFGKVTVTYEYKGTAKRRIFSDKCDFKTNYEYYCRGNRFAIKEFECDGTCWEESHCK